MKKKNIREIYMEGYRARVAGKPKSDCPYDTLRAAYNGSVVYYSRAFRKAWLRGWAAK